MLDINRYPAHELIPFTTFDSVRGTHNYTRKCLQFVVQTQKNEYNYTQLL